jgi:phage FluMu gp28-like protein
MFDVSGSNAGESRFAMLIPLRPIYFLPYQRDWILDASPLKICEKGRQIGLSYADSYDSVRKAILTGRDVWVMSRDEAQAKQYIRYCRRWARVLQLAAGDFGERLLRTTGGRAVQVQALTLANGATIYALSSNPDAVVGKTGHVKLDEFALHKDQRTLYAVAKPVTQWGGTLAIISTHRGARTVFNELLTDIRERGNPMGWSHHQISIQKAVAQGLVEKIDAGTRGELRREFEAGRDKAGDQENDKGAGDKGRSDEGLRAWWLARQRKECIDEEQWLQEYCCVPADEAAAFITFEMITACAEADCLRDHAYLARCANPLYLGVDVARKEDLCVLDVGERVGDVIWDRLRIELRGRTFTEIEGELYRLLELRQLKRACLDATGLGMQLAERARERFGWKVEAITFTATSKEELAFGLRSDFEDRRLRIADDAALRADLRGIRKEITLGGNIRFAGESADSHCDRFWAKALRQQAARARGAECGAMS